MSVAEHHSKEQESDEIEIRLSDIVQFLKNSRRSILIGGLVGLLIGTLYAFSKPNVYTSQVSVMPEIQGKGSGNLGGLGSLAGLAGINIDNLGAQDAIRPDLYPNVLQSMPFALYLLRQPVYSATLGKRLLFETYIHETGKTWFAGVFGSERSTEKIGSKSVADPRLIELTKEQNDLVEDIQSTVTAVYDKKTGILTISAIEAEPVVAAAVAQNSLGYLTNYITTYRTEKSRRQVDFLRRQVAEAKSRYQSSEYTLSSYRDSNRSVYLNTAKIEEQRLQADYLLTQSVYNELSKQLEQAKIKVQEETPVFKTLEPPAVPIQKSGPKRSIIMVICAVAGVILVILTQLTRAFLQRNSIQRV
jgi:uncharacterized protein involved in exopolysaccharide biosynthesis